MEIAMVWKDNETDAVLKVRMPRDLKEWLQSRAKDEFRPLNSEIVLALLRYRAGVEGPAKGRASKATA